MTRGVLWIWIGIVYLTQESAMSEPDYTVEPVREADVAGVIDLLKRTFYLDEPLNQAVGLCNPNEPCPEVEAYCKESLLEGLSYKAVDNQSNVIGVMISGVIPLKEADDGNDIFTQARNCKNPKFQKVLYILAARESCARLWEKFPQDKNLVEVKVAATDPNWRRKGIMHELLKKTESATLSRGFRLLRMDCSSYYSARAAERQGFTCYYSRNYKDIKMDDEPLIVPTEPHVNDTVYVKVLA